MYDLEKFYTDVYSGNDVDKEAFINYMKSFKNIIIWGAGNLGTAIGKKYIELGINISVYWDTNWQKIIERNGIKVIAPYKGDFDKSETLVVFCIANVPVSPKLWKELYSKDWINRLRGLAVLQGFICTMSKEKELDTGVCNRQNICTVCSCERLNNIMKHKAMLKRSISEKELLCFDRVHFIVNNFCNLKCTHCYLYMNSYPLERKKNIPIDELKKDIDKVMEAVDSFGVVNVFGGEPFLHPDISEAVEKILEKDNFGALILNTNGIAKMEEKQLKGLENRRIRLAFSNYIGEISDKQESIFRNNMNRAKDRGIQVQCQNELPTWNISSTLGNNNISDEIKKEYKKNCGVVYLYVFDHKIFPCSMSMSIYDLGVADYPGDYVEIREDETAEELKEKIRALINKEYYQCCGHCDHELGLAHTAGEQGFIERYMIPK